MTRNTLVLRSLLKSGFSLVEILVCVVVVGILFTLAFTVVGDISGSSRKVQCVQNLRTISGGLFRYVQENNGHLVPAAQISAPGVRTHIWYQALEEYIEPDPDLTFRSTKRPTWQQCPAKVFKAITYESSGYGWNYRHFGHRVRDIPGPGDLAGEPPRGESSRLVEVSKPAATIIVGDSKDSVDGEIYTHRYLYTQSVSAILNNMARRHQGKGNYLFLDGHIQAFYPEELVEKSELFLKVKD